jgi:hypothetical protein
MDKVYIRSRYLGGTVEIVAVAVIVTLSLVPVAGQTADISTLPQTAWGTPDLQGVWDFRSLTPFERPADLGGQETLTDEDAATAIAEANENWRKIQDGSVEMPTGSYNEAWYDATGVAEDRRSSLIVEPSDGRIPHVTRAAAKRQADIARTRRGLLAHDVSYGGWVEEIGPGHLAVRCIVGFNSGPPMTPSAYNNNVQLFQTENHIVLLNEMVHSARIIPLDGREHLDLRIRQQMGDSRGHWEDDALVVETKNFLRGTGFLGGQTDMHLRLVERFSRVSPETLLYEATLDDTTVWSRPWTFQLAMQRNDQPLYEYACHEGNYGLYNILAGAREEENAMEIAASKWETQLSESEGSR